MRANGLRDDQWDRIGDHRTGPRSSRWRSAMVGLRGGLFGASLSGASAPFPLLRKSGPVRKSPTQQVALALPSSRTLTLYQASLILTRGLPRRGASLIQSWRSEEFRHADPTALGL